MTHKQIILSHQFANGLTLVAQPMLWLESAAFSISVPAGCRYDPTDKKGLANFTCEMALRGCGDLTNRQFVEALEFNGVDHSSNVSVYNTNFGGSMLASRLHDTLGIFATMLQRPLFPEDQLEDGRQVCFMEVAALEDELAQRAILELRSRFYGDPDGRTSEGDFESLKSITIEDIKAFHQQHYRPDETIVSVAGKFDWDALKDHVGSLLGDWSSKPSVAVDVIEPSRQSHHISFPSEQTHIAVAYPALPYCSDDYFLNRGSVGVLSDGLSSRLFTEVREKRGLCYTVSASYHSLRDRACVVCYSGTTTQRAQETLDVLIDQLKLLRDGIDEAELRRLQIQVRSSLIMQQESCRARANAIAGDWMHLGRVRTLNEINEKITGLTVASVNQFLADHPPRDFLVVTLGAESLEFQRDIVSAT